MFTRFIIKFLIKYGYGNFILDPARCDKIIGDENNKLKIFAIPNLFFIDYLLIRKAIKLAGVSKSVGIFGHKKNIFEKIGDLFSAIFNKKDPEKKKSITDFIAENKSITISVGFTKRGEGEITKDSFNILNELIRAEKQLKRNIELVPLFITWGNKPKRGLFSFMDILLGPNNDPGLFRKIYKMLHKSKKRAINIGNTIDLSKIIATTDNPASEVTASLQESIKQEQFVVFGPKPRSKEKVINDIITDPQFVAYLEGKAKDKADEAKLRKKAIEMLNEIAADLDYRFVEGFSFFLNFLWKNIYRGIIISNRDLEKIRNYLKKGTVVFVPSHKSHIDYLLVSYLLHLNGIVVPHIVAGVNLSFWPMGYLFGHSGAYFIRRSFENDFFYANVFEAYVAYLTKSGYSHELFIEGGRSRTGKLEFPKMGFISIILKSFLKGDTRDLLFVPISISYEKILEEKSYIKELSGKEKKKESFFDLLKMKKFLKINYGKVYLNVGDAVSPLDFIKPEDLADPDKKGRELQFNLSKNIAFNIMHGINKEVTIVSIHLISALLLSDSERSMTLEELKEGFGFLLRYLKALNCRFSDEIFEEDASEKVLERLIFEGVIKKIESIGTQVYYPVEAKSRINLYYYKNIFIHFLLPSAMVCFYFRNLNKGGSLFLNREDFDKHLSDYKERLKFEFVLREGEEFQKEVSIHFNLLKEFNILEEIQQEGNSMEILSKNKAAFYLLSNIMRPFFESYELTADFINKAPENFAMEDKNLEKMLLNHGNFLLKTGELKYPEAINKSTIKNSVKYFEKRRAFRSNTEGTKKFLKIDKNKMEDFVFFTKDLK